MMLSVTLIADDPVTGYVWGAPSPELAVACKFVRSTVYGGPATAEVEVRGPEVLLWGVLDWLRRPVEVRGPQSNVVWWGFVNEVQLEIGGRTIGRSLDDLVNRVAVAYAAPSATGATERRTTMWAEDAASVGQYGVRELLYSGGVMEPGEATALRDRLLLQGAQPRGLQSFRAGGNEGVARATLGCVGWMESLRWRRFARTGTRVEFEGSSGDLQAIGWQLVSGDVFFTASDGMHDLQARLVGLRINNTIAVSGAAPANNHEFVITRATGDGRRVYTANTIYFQQEDDIYDSAKGLAFIRNGALIRISGSAQNSKVWQIDGTQTPGYVTTSGLGGMIIDEVAGPSIMIEQGHNVMVSPKPANSLSTGVKTVTLYGYRMAQSFMPGASIALGMAAVQINRIGSPSDTLRLSVHADTAGAPGTQLTFTDIAGADVPENSEWVWFLFATPLPLTSGTTYWIVVERSGALSAEDYYQLAMTTEASGVCLAYTGATWAANPTGMSMPHKLWGVEETTTQLVRVIEDVGDLLAAVVIDSVSGVLSNPEQAGDASAYDVVMKLLKVGTASGGRLLAMVDRDRVLRVLVEPVAPNEPDVYMLAGYVRLPSEGQRRLVGELPVGEWLTIERTPAHLVGLSPAFVDEAEFDGTALGITPRRVRDGAL